MNITQLLRSIPCIVSSLAPVRYAGLRPVMSGISRPFHGICNKQGPFLPQCTPLHKPDLLTILKPLPTICNLVRGMKVKHNLRLRCVHCYKVVRHERMYVMCSKYPRHKQMSMKPKPYKKWILTSASQSPKRPW